MRRRGSLLAIAATAAAGSLLTPADDATVARVEAWATNMIAAIPDDMSHSDPNNPLKYVQGSPEIVFAIATGTEHLSDRAAGVLDSWCSKINACVFFSDAGNPSGHPVTVPIQVQGAPANMEKYKLAQLRFLPILENMRIWLTENKYGLFDNCKWVVLCDDDTYIFYQNLKNALSTLNSAKPIYAGNVIPANYLPVHQDGSGNELGVSSNTAFVFGGGGSIFSAVGLRQMVGVHQCVINQQPGQLWDKWQSDWMIGKCAYDAGMPATRMTKGLFNQFVCTDEDNHVHFCIYGKDVDAELTEPATLHPIKQIETMKLLREDYPLADYMPVRDIVVQVAKGEMHVLRRAEVAEYHARKAREAEAARAEKGHERTHGHGSVAHNKTKP